MDTTKKEESVMEREGYLSQPLSPLPPHIDTTNNAPIVPMPDSHPEDQSKAKGPSTQTRNVEPLNPGDISERGHDQRRY